jgi:hypothetical protein
MEWIRRSAWAVSTYFGQFPVRQVGLLVIADDSTRIGSGAADGFSHSAIRIHVGRGVNDAATHTHVVSSLYAAMRSSPAPIDVADLFRQLGVTERNGAIVYDDGAPLARIRRRITEPRDGSEREILVRF